MENIVEINDKQMKKAIVHRRAVKRWKEEHRDQHLIHRQKEYTNKKIKFIFLNILLE